MAVKSSVNWISQQRVDIPDLRAIESGVVSDLSTLIQCFVGDTPYILNGFTIPVSGISGPATSLQMVTASSVVWLPDDTNGSFLRVPSGTPNEVLSPSNPNVVGSFSPGPNFVSLQFNRATDPATSDLISVWDVDAGSEFDETVPRGLVMNYQIVINGTSFGNNAPVAIVNVSGSNVTSIQNCKQGLFRLGRGGANPDINYSYTYTVNPENSLLATSNSSPDPFVGGDWQLQTWKNWCDAVMTEIKMLKNSAFWYGTNSVIPGANITDLYFDAVNSKITGAGAWQHSSSTPGMLTWTSNLNIRSVFGTMSLTIPAGSVTLSDSYVAYLSLVRNYDFQPASTFTFTNGSTAVTSSLSVSGISVGDYIKYEADNISAWAKISNISGTSITLSSAYTGTSASGKALQTVGSYTMQTAAPNSVPVNANTFWIAKRDDNGFTSLTIASSGSNGLTRTSDVTTLITTTPHGLVTGQSFAVSGASDSSFDGKFDVQTVNSTTSISYYNPGANFSSGSAGSGTVSSVPKIYLRGGGTGELEQGESVQIDDETTLNIIAFIGAEDATDTTPPYDIIPNGLSEYTFTSANNLTQAISATTGNVNNILTALNNPAYDEPLLLIASGSVTNNQIIGPISSGTNITLPLNSREALATQTYTVGKGWLDIFLNGQFLSLTVAGATSGGWTEVGSSGSASTTIQINQDLVVGDVLEFKIRMPGGPGSGSGAPDDNFHTLASSTSTNPATEFLIWDADVSAYRKETRANVLAGVSNTLQVHTYASNTTANTTTDDVLIMNASSSILTVTLPAAASATGKVFYIKKIDSTGNTVTIQGNGSETVDGSNTQVINTQYQARTIVSDGTQWWIV